MAVLHQLKKCIYYFRQGEGDLFDYLPVKLSTKFSNNKIKDYHLICKIECDRNLWQNMPNKIDMF